MLRSVRLGSVQGIGVFIHPTFWLLPLFLAMGLMREVTFPETVFQLTLFFAIISCVILHEFGHALAAKSFGIGTRSITLYPIGGMARLEKMSNGPFEELVITLAGPAVNFAFSLALCPFWLTNFPLGMEFLDTWGGNFSLWGLTVLFFRMLCLANLVLLGFNLLPFFPMDGGRLLRGLISWRYGLVTATRFATAFSGVGALVFVLAGFYSGNFFFFIMAIFIYLAGKVELASVLIQNRQQENYSGSPKASWGAGFNGLSWDPLRQGWVQWVDGQAVSFHTRKPE